MRIIGNPHLGRNGVVHCTCDRTYCASDAADALEHARHHREFTRVTRNHGHVPCGHALCEQLKDAGRELLRTATSDADVGVAADMLVRAYFDRSFSRSINHGVGDLHPSLPSYARTISEDGQFDPRVNAALLAAYREAQRAPGTIVGTIWDPPLYVMAWAANTETN